MADQQSIDFSQGESFHILPLTNQPISQHAKLFQTTNLNPSVIINSCLNVLSQKKLTSGYSLNSQFQQYLLEDAKNPQTIVVSIIGSKKIGKSFLLDCLLSMQLNKVTRIMSKSKQTIINSPAIIRTRSSNIQSSANQPKLVYLDNCGDLNNQLFLWNYFISSIMVFNVSVNDSQALRSFSDCLTYIQTHFQANRDEIVLPRLIIVVRDCNNDKQKSGSSYKQFVKQISALNLFQTPISVINMNYPGIQTVPSRQILDVPINQLNEQFLGQIRKLLQTLKSSVPKSLKGTYLTTKILSLALQPATNQINRNQKVSVDKIWNEIVQKLSAGYYNFYLKSYEEELIKEFQGQEPIGKFELHKKLQNTSRKVNRRVQGFKNLDNDAIFARYKQKLNTVIKSKQQLIKNINKQKSRESNDRYCKKLLTELDNNNSNQLLSQYCKSELDEYKCQVLLENFGRAVEQRSKLAAKKKSGKQNSTEYQIQFVQKQIKDLQKKLNDQKLKEGKPFYDLDSKSNQYQIKKNKFKALEKQHEGHKTKLNQNNDKIIQQYRKLEEQSNKITQKIQDYDEQMNQLRAKRQQDMRNSTKQLTGRLKKQQQTLRMLQQKLLQAKNRFKTNSKPQKPQKKSEGCCCVIM